MSQSVIDLSEHVAEGLLWVHPDGLIRHANVPARRRTALRAGDRLNDVALVRAVQVVGRTRQPRVSALGLGESMLRCQVLPGLGSGDAFVLLADAAPPPGADEGADRLLRAVDQGLRVPLQMAGETLRLWRQEGDAHAAALLAGQIEELLRGLDRLIDMGEVWSGDRSADDERLELWPLLQSAWCEVEPQALDRGVGVRFRTHGEIAAQATLYGNRRWLMRVFTECLAAAVAATPEGGQLEIEHRQVGPNARLLFRDCRLFGRRDGGRIDTVALMLCRQVLALHGGILGPDDGGEGWFVELPTGAPAHVDEAALGIAQAQSYARDLAALMNRSRARPDASVK